MAGDKIVRLGQLVSSLCAHAGEGLASEDLAYLCGAPHEIVNADLEMLSRSFPIYSIPETTDPEEPRFWYYENLGDKSFYPASALSVREAMALLTALENAPELEEIREKLAASLFDDAPLHKKLKPRRIYQGGKPPYDDLQSSSQVYELAKACGRRRMLLEYCNQRGESSKRSIDPLGLVYCWATGAWYLIAFSVHNDAIRSFRVDRIVNCRQVGKAAAHDFCLHEYVASAWGAQVVDPLYEVKIRFFDHFNVFSRVRRETKERPHAEIRQESSDTIIYTDLVMGLKEFRVWIRSFGASAQVIAPEKLRRELIDSYRRILERY